MLIVIVNTFLLLLAVGYFMVWLYFFIHLVGCFYTILFRSVARSSIAHFACPSVRLSVCPSVADG